jgi:tRNA_anti-like
MITTNNKITIAHLASTVVLAASFFLSWVNWGSTGITGANLPSGIFFKTADTQFGLPNPFPQLSFLFNIFWLIPAAALIAAILNLLKKNTFWPSIIAGALGLSVVIVFYLFSNQLIQLGTTRTLQPWLFVHALAAIALILTAGNSNWFAKAGLILVTVFATYFGFNIAGKQAEKKIFDKTHESTGSVKADFTIEASSLIKEFLANDTTARNKYNEKVLEVSGPVTEVVVAADSTSTIKFADSTGSYAIFSFEKNDMTKVQLIKPGDNIAVKGVCSGSIFSDILGTTSISFKRSVLNK